MEDIGNVVNFLACAFYVKDLSPGKYHSFTYFFVKKIFPTFFFLSFHKFDKAALNTTTIILFSLFTWLCAVA